MTMPLRLADVEEAAHAVSSAAEQLGHDLHPWRIEGRRASTACRACGATAGLELDGREPWASGPATLEECEAGGAR